MEGAIEATKEFLGILVDTIKGEQRISEDRIAVGLERLKELDGKSYVATRELRSLVGVLSFAARCCRDWNDPISWPNCLRLLRYSSVMSNAA